MKKRTYSFGPSKLHIEFGDITTSDAQVIVSSDDYYFNMGHYVVVGGGRPLKDRSREKTPPRAKTDD